MRRIYRRPKPDNVDKKFRVNALITAPRIILIDENNVYHGEVDLAFAKKLAEEAELDLDEVNPTGKPPTCKIIDYGQFKYERDKKVQKQKVQQKKTDTKCVRLSVRIGEHDFNIRLEQGRKFLLRGDKLKMELLLKGREKQHADLGREVMFKYLTLIKQTEGLEVTEEEPLTRQGGKFNMLIANKKG